MVDKGTVYTEIHVNDDQDAFWNTRKKLTSQPIDLTVSQGSLN